MSNPKHKNHLDGETSPYLLQHAHNPVGWYPWGEEALSRARKEDRPIFLSIGYAACHWCHVMERESFENEEIAAFLNAHFVCIKVDREERPDLDDLYMTAVQMMTGAGGWPMSVFLTPTLEPFHAGTYFPPVDSYGRPGFLTVIRGVAAAWEERREEVLHHGSMLKDALQRHMAASETSTGAVTEELTANAVRELRSVYDEAEGGFGPAPKFPPSGAIGLLLRYHARTRDAIALKMATHTLSKMACGGMYDQVGGGFHRYSTDAHWLVPHFEKMLYDNALLADVYLEAYQSTGNALYQQIAHETLDYVLRDMQDADGGFHSSEDADSDGQEGVFYIWTREELDAILGKKEARSACSYYGVNDEGNFPSHEPYHAGKNILHVEHVGAGGEKVAAWRDKLIEARSQRTRPGRDDKVLTAWNALMISALAHGYQVLGDTRYCDAAVGTGEYLLSRMLEGDTLYRSYRKGDRRVPGFLDDYAFTLVAFIDLYETTFDLKWIEAAERLAQRMTAGFWDEEAGRFLSTSDAHEALIARSAPIYDGAEPSGNTMAALGLLRLGALTDIADYLTKARHVIKGACENMSQYPQAHLRMIAVAELLLQPPTEIALVGPMRSETIRDFLRVIYRQFQPNKVIAHIDPSIPDALKAELRIPLLSGKGQVQGRPAAYVCHDHTCLAPATHPDALVRILADDAARPDATVRRS